MYTSREWFEIEQKYVFDATWICVGFASDVPNNGDLYPAEVAGRPLLILRDQQVRKEAQVMRQGVKIRQYMVGQSLLCDSTVGCSK